MLPIILLRMTDLVVWTGISMEGHKDPYRLSNNTLTAIRYPWITWQTLHQCSGCWGPPGARPCPASCVRACRQFLEVERLHTINWLPSSPDLNPTELGHYVSVHPVVLGCISDCPGAQRCLGPDRGGDPPGNNPSLGCCQAYKRTTECHSELLQLNEIAIKMDSPATSFFQPTVDW